MSDGSAMLTAARQILELPRTLFEVAGWNECIESLNRGGATSFDSVWGSSCALLATAIHEATHRPLLCVLADEKIADQFVDDVPLFAPHEVSQFPTHENRDDLSTDPGYGQRLKLLKDLSAGHVPPIMAASIQALVLPVPSRRAIRDGSFWVRNGQRLDLDAFRHWLVQNQYQSTTAVQMPGEFSSRGGIVDVFAPDWSLPARIELFDDVVESIRFFDVNSQRSMDKCEAIEIAGLTDRQNIQSHFCEFLPQNALVLLAEPGEIASQSRLMHERLSGIGEMHELSAIQQSWRHLAVALAGRLITDQDTQYCRLPVTPLDQFSGDISNVRQEVDRLASGRHLHLIAATESEINRVTEILKPTAAFAEQRIQFSVGSLHAGFRLDHVGAALLGCDQLFGRSDLRRTAQRRGGKAIDSFVDLRAGDLIVHLAHGIGRFRGLKLLEKEGHHTEHLELEFHAGTRIYVPATKIGLVQKYVGGTKTRPRLARIGNKSWVKQKQAAEQAVNDLAAEMLELQATRNTRPGIAFALDSQWQFEFEHSFPYHETDDQVSAIEAIKSDMESDRPMERLLCGDVGFGKTELAMRAAFKAVESGYQVAMLVPTTVLAEQHYRTFKQRMAEFPVDIARLSRFSTGGEQREVVELLASGKMDIVIGTHRLVSKDVAFRNLGLVIIDEEQRFGVSHKERLKTLRREVDCLTMSATPIPRTLHMSLVGVRDISNLETPPEDRLAVQTRVTRLDPELVREAILRELSRGGQTYFVHNRVKDIHLIKSQLQHIVPEARIGVGHGQMAEGELARTMTRFIDGRYDILLATTIVENGLDIPNANTIFINEAERYGLADLHQLRGRVGRYKNKAYCYLLVDPRKHVNPTAAKRLRAIEQYSEMGAGFAIAMRDLEIRGAGNLLGTEQSGHIASVGYELYCQLLENAVRRLKRMPAKISMDVDIDLPIEAYLPDEYVVDRQQKVDFYRRMYRVETFDDIDALKRELQDRFGPLPASVKRLTRLAEIKLEASLWQIKSVFLEDKYLGIRFADAARMRQLADQTQYNLRIVDDSTAYLTLRKTEIPPDKLISLLKSILQLPAGVT